MIGKGKSSYGSKPAVSSSGCVGLRLALPRSEWRRNEERLGFTLVELLIVIAIVAILAAMLFPAMAGAQAQADSTLCKNNLRQFALGVSAYVGDGGTYPFTWDWGTNAFPVPYGDANWWADRLFPYTHSLWPDSLYLPEKNIYVCPGYNRKPGVYASQSNIRGAYAINTEGVAARSGISGLGFFGSAPAPAGSFSWAPVWERQVMVPSQMLMASDCEVLEGPLAYANGPLSYIGEVELVYNLSVLGLNNVNLTSALRRRHSGRYNAMFCDGHVEELQAAQLFQTGPPNDQLAVRWNLDHQPHEDLTTPILMQ